MKLRNTLACGSISRLRAAVFIGRTLMWLGYLHHAFNGKRPHYFLSTPQKKIPLNAGCCNWLFLDSFLDCI